MIIFQRPVFQNAPQLGGPVFQNAPQPLSVERLHLAKPAAGQAEAAGRASAAGEWKWKFKSARSLILVSCSVLGKLYAGKSYSEGKGPSGPCTYLRNIIHLG